MLGNSVVVVCTRPRAIPLAMKTMKNSWEIAVVFWINDKCPILLGSIVVQASQNNFALLISLQFRLTK